MGKKYVIFCMHFKFVMLGTVFSQQINLQANSSYQNTNTVINYAYCTYMYLKITKSQQIVNGAKCKCVLYIHLLFLLYPYMQSLPWTESDGFRNVRDYHIIHLHCEKYYKWHSNEPELQDGKIKIQCFKAPSQV